MRPNIKAIPCAMMDLVRQNYGDHYIAVNNNRHPGAVLRTQPDVGAKKLVTIKNENVKCFQNIFYFHLDLTTVIKITRSLDSELCQSSRWKLWKLSGYTFSICQR